LRLTTYLRLAPPPPRPRSTGAGLTDSFWPKANRDRAIKAEGGDISNHFAELFREAIRDGIRHGEFHPSGTVEKVADTLLIDALCLEPGLDANQRRRSLRYVAKRRGDKPG
jgi:hypothetical protein